MTRSGCVQRCGSRADSTGMGTRAKAADLARTLQRAFDDTLSSMGIEKTANLAVALSGGADSVALAHLASKWKQHGGGVHPAVALIVDHGIRAESRREALHAQSVAQSLGMEAHLLSLRHSQDWPPQKRGYLLQTARKHRYKAMLDVCEAKGLPVLLTGHHAGLVSAKDWYWRVGDLGIIWRFYQCLLPEQQLCLGVDDQAELFLIRFSRGSGIDGLAGSPFSTAFSPGGVQLVRPLLHARKEELVQLCREEGLEWVEDPTNRDTTFIRNLLRHRIGERSEAAATHSGDAEVGSEAGRTLRSQTSDGAPSPGASADLVGDILRLSRACARAREQLNESASSLVAAVKERGEAALFQEFARRHSVAGDQSSRNRSIRGERMVLHLKPFADADRSTALRALGKIFMGLSGDDFPPNLANLSKILDRIRCGNIRNSRGMLPVSFVTAGCEILPVAGLRGEVVYIKPQRSNPSERHSQPAASTFRQVMWPGERMSQQSDDTER